LYFERAPVAIDAHGIVVNTRVPGFMNPIHFGIKFDDYDIKRVFYYVPINRLEMISNSQPGVCANFEVAGGSGCWQVAGLVEWPVAIASRIDDDFCLPPEVLQT
jgi:hypothetical protein